MWQEPGKLYLRKVYRLCFVCHFCLRRFSTLQHTDCSVDHTTLLQPKLGGYECATLQYSCIGCLLTMETSLKAWFELFNTTPLEQSICISLDLRVRVEDVLIDYIEGYKRSAAVCVGRSAACLGGDLAWEGAEVIERKNIRPVYAVLGISSERCEAVNTKPPAALSYILLFG